MNINKYLSTKYLYWNEGAIGIGVRIGIFDTGISNTTQCNSVVKKKNFSDEEDYQDLQGHGTYVASIICDLSPHAEIYVYKVFNSEGDTNKKWIKDALNEATTKDEVDIINLSFGGINFNDNDVTELIDMAVEKGIIVISSAGNEGPSYGTISFPGNRYNVITVGSVSSEIFTVYSHSSRGPAMNDKNLLIAKPNTWSIGEDVYGFDHTGNKVCRNGSSASTAIVSGFISLGMSYDSDIDWNTSVAMGMIYDSNLEMVGLNSFEKVSGLFNPQGMLGIVKNYSKVKVKNEFRILGNYNFDEQFYSTMQSKNIILTVLNYLNNYDNIKQPIIIKVTNQTPLDNNCIGFSIKNPYAKIGRVFYLNLEIFSDSSPKCAYYKNHHSYRIIFSDSNKNHQFELQLSFDFIPKPNKLNRILFDRHHDLIYPFDGAVPKDDLFSESFNSDWTYENIYTNYYSFYAKLKSEGYFVEEARKSLSCIDINEYSVIIIIDNEKKLTLNEIKKLQYHYENSNVSLMIITEWSSKNVVRQDNGILGSDVDSINSLLLKYMIGVSNDSLTSTFYLSGKKVMIRSGSSIALFPKGGLLFGGEASNDEDFLNVTTKERKVKGVFGLYENSSEDTGRIGVFTDTYCLDDYQLSYDIDNNCFWLLINSLRFLIHGTYAYNELDFSNREILSDTYFNNKPLSLGYDDSIEGECPNNFEAFNDNQIIIEKLISKEISSTSIIPNVFKSVGDGEKSALSKSDMLNVIKFLLLIFLPILFILMIMLFVIQCKAKEAQHRRTIDTKAILEMSSKRKRYNSVSSNTSTERELNIEKISNI